MSFWRSKHDLFKYYTEHKQACLPERNKIKVGKYDSLLRSTLKFLAFLRQMVCGEKKVLLKKDVIAVNVPFYPAVRILLSH